MSLKNMIEGISFFKLIYRLDREPNVQIMNLTNNVSDNYH